MSAWTVAVGVEVDIVRGSSVRVGRSLLYGLARHYGAHHILAASTDRADRRTKPVSPDRRTGLLLAEAHHVGDAMVAAGGVATVDGDGLAADEAGVRGQQEGGDGRDLLGATESPQLVLVA